MEALKKIGRAWNSVSLIKRIVVGLAIGTVLALLWPGNAIIELLGTLFVWCSSWSSARWPTPARPVP